ncbi:MAG: CHAT domain-containing tetratricopeptide repeat protein [Bacteroidota bacterium]
MRCSLSFIFFCLLWQFGFGQQETPAESIQQLNAQGQYDRAIQLADSLLVQWRPPDSMAYRDILQYQAAAYAAKGIYEKALQNFLTIEPFYPQEDYLEKVRIWRNIGTQYTRLQNKEQALTYFDRAIQYGLKHLPPGNLEVIMAYKDRSSLYSIFQEYDRANEGFREGLLLLKKYGVADSSLLGDFLLNHGGTFIQALLPDSAVVYLQKAKDVYKKVLPPNSPKIGSALINLAIIQSDRGYFRQADQYYSECKKIWEAHYPSNHPRLAALYINYANTIRQAGDMYRALVYLLKAYDLSRAIFGQNHTYTQGACTNISAVYKQLGELDKALKFSKEAYQIAINKNMENFLEAIRIKGSIAEILGLKGQTDEAIKVYKEAIQALQAQQFIVALGEQYNNLGLQYLQKGDTQNAIDQFQKSLESFEKVPADTEHLRVTTNVNLAQLYTEKGDFQKANQFFQKAESLMKQRDAQSPIPLLTQLKFLEQKGQSLLMEYKATKDIDLLHQAEAIHQKAMDHYNSWQVQLEESESLAYSAKHSNKLFANALETNFLLFEKKQQASHFNQAFAYAELSKSQSLKRSLQINSAALKNSIPDSILAQEQRLKKDISELQLQIDQSIPIAKSSDEVRSLKTALFEKKQSFQKFLEEVAIDFPAYYQVRYQSKLPSASAVSDQLEDQTALIEFALFDNTLYTFLIFKGENHLFQSKLSADFMADIRAFHQRLSRPTKSFEEIAHRLYQQLMASIIQQLPADVQHLCIIPDGILSYIPFEALLMEEPPIADGHLQHAWLLRSYRISYAYTTDLLHTAPHKSSAPRQAILGLAPSYENFLLGRADSILQDPLSQLVRSGQLPLPGARAELQAIENIWPTTSYYDTSATERQFKESAPEFQILHLSMHSLANTYNPLYSSLLFNRTADSIEDGRLYTTEIYNMRLSADLAVLSACNTGFGQLQAGEGVRSISRAFFNAGIASTVTSLWNVPDESTRQIMVRFYQKLREGLSKDEALRQSKLKYLQNIKAPQQAHPFYWAGFVCNGEVSPLATNQRTTSWLYSLLAILGVLLLVLLFSKIFQKKSNAR